jgi:hypothetical protein
MPFGKWLKLEIFKIFISVWNYGHERRYEMWLIFKLCIEWYQNTYINSLNKVNNI